MGVFDYKAAKKTNASNQKINQANIDYSWKALNAQNQFNVEQWNRENAYNDPSAQMRRYLAAGINPWNAMSNIDNGNASSVTSASYSPPSMIPMQQPNQSAVGGVLQSIQSALDGSLKIMDIFKGGNTMKDEIKGLNAFNQGRVLDTDFLRDTNKNRIAATNQIYKTQQYTAANEAAYQLALTKFGMTERAATTFSNWITSRETGRQTLENLKDMHLINGKVLEWYDKDHEANFEKLMASAGVDRQTIKRMEEELPFIADFIQAQIKELDSRADLNSENANDLRQTRSARISNLESQTNLNNENATDLHETRPRRKDLLYALQKYNRAFAHYYQQQAGWIDFNNKKEVVKDVIDAYLRYRQQNIDDENSKDRNSTSEKLGLGSLIVHLLSFIK